MKSFNKYNNMTFKSIFRPFLIFFLSFLLLTVNWGICPGQNKYPTKIVLKDGTKIKGNVFDSFEGKYIKIYIDTIQPVLINSDRIHKITFKDSQGQHTLKMNDEKLISKKIGLKNNTFYHELRGGILLGEDNTSITLHNINGYQFNRFLAPGIGIGFDSYEKYRTVPVYAHLKGYIFDRRTAPFYFAEAGYGFAWYNDEEEYAFDVTDVHGGYYWQIGLGYRISFNHLAMLITLGYKNQKSGLKYIYDVQPWMSVTYENDVEVSEQRILRRAAFSIGFLF